MNVNEIKDTLTSIHREFINKYLYEYVKVYGAVLKVKNVELESDGLTLSGYGVNWASSDYGKNVSVTIPFGSIESNLKIITSTEFFAKIDEEWEQFKNSIGRN